MINSSPALGTYDEFYILEYQTKSFHIGEICIIHIRICLFYCKQTKSQTPFVLPSLMGGVHSSLWSLQPDEMFQI